MDGLCQLSGMDLWEKICGEMECEMHGHSLAGWGRSLNLG